MIAMVAQLLNAFNVSNVDIQLNSVGCKNCRPTYREQLKAYLASSYNDLCQDCRNRFERNPMRILDCKQEGCQKIAASAPVMIDHYCQDCHAHFSELQEYLGIWGIEFQMNPRMVRGLDYYVRTQHLNLFLRR
jgi:histidyl-tRNA synthetase